ncbi:cGMP-dependent protein kinase 1 [Melipona quadrifasciata]|uniref:cGMP-dependent protein kinase 1 n=1 Tax=Melipona quadrifasciata TaxID=166423 RepID=A0A0N0BEY4_9HYME|nr:cGMP-dependent protein kinase 1 [Melipona quadrifasciata]
MTLRSDRVGRNEKRRGCGVTRKAIVVEKEWGVPIGDACVSMRVCFDSLCFSSTQQRLADEEDASQLPTHGAVAVVAAAGQRAISNVTGATTITAMGTLRELQELLRVKDEKIAELEALLCRRDAEIQDLRSHLDKFLSVLPFKSPLTPTKPRPRKQRAQGISAEPPLQELATLTIVDKSDSSDSSDVSSYRTLTSFLFSNASNVVAANQ